MITTGTGKLLLGLAAALVATVLAATAQGAMSSERLAPNLCETTGGARYVDLPGFPGERIDRRLLNDIRLLERRYKIFVNDGYSTDPVHAFNGEHPIGLALDIVPNFAEGGTWRDLTALAKRAEPQQNQVVAPWRWVGYDGDAGHGRGNHLHLSWNHSETKPGVAPDTVYTLRCPGSKARKGGGGGGGEPQPDGGKEPGQATGGGAKEEKPSASGGVQPGTGTTGGISADRLALLGAEPVAETGGVGLP